MTNFRLAAIAAASLAGSAAQAQTTIITSEPAQTQTIVRERVELTPVQRQTIYRTIVRERCCAGAAADRRLSYRHARSGDRHALSGAGDGCGRSAGGEALQIHGGQWASRAGRSGYQRSRRGSRRLSRFPLATCGPALRRQAVCIGMREFNSAPCSAGSDPLSLRRRRWRSSSSSECIVRDASREFFAKPCSVFSQT